MDENIELLNYIYEDAVMGVQSMTILSDSLKDKDNKIKKPIDDIIKGYEKILKEAKKQLKSSKAEIKEPGLMAKMGSWMGIKTEVIKDNSDSRLADMIIKGFTMGTLNMDKKIDAFDKNTDSDVKKLAKDLRKFQDEGIELLKPYL